MCHIRTLTASFGCLYYCWTENWNGIMEWNMERSMECIANMLLPPCMVQLAHHQLISYYSVTKPDSHTKSDSLAS